MDKPLLSETGETRAENYLSSSMMVECAPELLKVDPEGSGRFLPIDMEDAPL